MPSTQFPHHIVSIHGVPRSGTSWLGQIFNSHPNVAYRHQPLFAYRFKDRISLDSSAVEIHTFLDRLYQTTDDDFILDRREAYENQLPDWERRVQPDWMVIKMVRYHHLIEHFLQNVETFQVIGIVRHPCAVINSWLKAPKEFRPGWDAMQEWRFAPLKNQDRVEEFNGFEKWKEVAARFMELERRYPQRFVLIRYEHLVSDPESAVRAMFDFVQLPFHPQVAQFLKISQKQHSSHPYSVFKHPTVKDRWKDELDPRIQTAILKEVEGSPLAKFIE